MRTQHGPVVLIPQLRYTNPTTNAVVVRAVVGVQHVVAAQEHVNTAVLDVVKNAHIVRTVEMDELMAGIAGLKAGREAEYEKILSKLSSHGYERKFVAYKLNSAIKYESHVRNEKHK